MLLTDVLLDGFFGKTKMILQPDNVVSYNGDGSLTILFPTLTDKQELAHLISATIEFLRKPAYYQFYEEDLLDYRCGLSVSDEQTTGFDELYEEAKQALAQSGEQDGQRIRIYGQTAGNA